MSESKEDSVALCGTLGCILEDGHTGLHSIPMSEGKAWPSKLVAHALRALSLTAGALAVAARNVAIALAVVALA